MLVFARWCIVYVGGVITHFATDYGLLTVGSGVTEGDLRKYPEEIEKAHELAFLSCGEDGALLIRNKNGLVVSFRGQARVAE